MILHKGWGQMIKLTSFPVFLYLHDLFPHFFSLSHTLPASQVCSTCCESPQPPSLSLARWNSGLCGSRWKGILGSSPRVQLAILQDKGGGHVEDGHNRKRSMNLIPHFKWSKVKNVPSNNLGLDKKKVLHADELFYFDICKLRSPPSPQYLHQRCSSVII